MADVLDTPEQIERMRKFVIWQCVKNHAERPAHAAGTNLCDECWEQRGPRAVPRGA